MKRVATLIVLAAVGCRKGAEAPNATSAVRGISPRQATDLDPADDVVQVRLRPERAPDGSYTYNGISPGPTIRAKVGDLVKVTLTNGLTQGTTIHWHGVKVPWEMDGVTWMGAPVGPGDTFEYEFRVSKSGTFWYHPHFNTESQVDRGLYGALIVEDPAEPTTDDEVVLFLDEEDEDHPASHAHGRGLLAPKWRINGQRRPTLTLASGTTTRVRVINASNAAYAALRWPDLRQIGSDQGLTSSLLQPGRVVLGPGDRMEAEWRNGPDDFVVVAERYSLNGGDSYGEPVELLEVQATGSNPRPAGERWVFSGAPPSEDPGSTDIVYALTGSDRTEQWRINGERFPDVTIETVPLGSTVIIEVRNISPTEHPFHLHGLDFEILSVNGRAPPLRMIEDTYNLRIHDRVRLRVVADNPGDWMTHCHILPHAGDGMMTVLRVQQ